MRTIALAKTKPEPSLFLQGRPWKHGPDKAIFYRYMLRLTKAGTVVEIFRQDRPKLPIAKTTIKGTTIIEKIEPESI